MNNDAVDILIIGGGMVGASLAAALQHSAYNVGLIEANAAQHQQQSGYDDRSTALSYGSQQILHKLGVWQPMSAYAEPIKTIHVSNRGYFGVTRIKAADEGVPALGYVAENRRIAGVLNDALKTESCRQYRPARLQSLKIHAGHVEALIDHNGQRKSVSAKLVVAADGARSTIRRLLNMTPHASDYDQSAIIANVTPQLSHQNIAYERFTENGPLAVLPKVAEEDNKPRCTAVWTVAKAKYKELMDLDEHSFLTRFQQAFGYRLGRFLKVGRRSSYPLSLVSSKASTAERILFIGNAAQTLHPVAGQGFNLALRDTAVLIQELLHNERSAKDPGDRDLLSGFEQKRQRDRRRVIRYTDMLVKVFSNHFSPLAHTRSLGLLAVELVPWLRAELAKQSMGLNVPLPFLYREP